MSQYANLSRRHEEYINLKNNLKSQAGYYSVYNPLKDTNGNSLLEGELAFTSISYFNKLSFPKNLIPIFTSLNDIVLPLSSNNPPILELTNAFDKHFTFKGVVRIPGSFNKNDTYNSTDPLIESNGVQKVYVSEDVEAGESLFFILPKKTETLSWIKPTGFSLDRLVAKVVPLSYLFKNPENLLQNYIDNVSEEVFKLYINICLISIIFYVLFLLKRDELRRERGGIRIAADLRLTKTDLINSSVDYINCYYRYPFQREYELNLTPPAQFAAASLFDNRRGAVYAPLGGDINAYTQYTHEGIDLTAGVPRIHELEDNFWNDRVVQNLAVVAGAQVDNLDRADYLINTYSSMSPPSVDEHIFVKDIIETFDVLKDVLKDDFKYFV